jgi:hypothetical protein
MILSALKQSGFLHCENASQCHTIHTYTHTYIAKVKSVVPIVFVVYIRKFHPAFPFIVRYMIKHKE